MSTTNFFQYYDESTDEVKLRFLRSILNANIDLQNQFQLYAQTIPIYVERQLMTFNEFMNEIIEIVAQIKDNVLEIDPEDMDYDDYEYRGYYRKDWEITEDLINRKLEETIEGYIDDITIYIKLGNAEETMAYSIGVLEGIKTADYSGLDYFCGGADDAIMTSFTSSTTEAMEMITQAEFTPQSITNALTFTLNHLESKLISLDRDSLKIIDDWLFAFGKHKDCDLNPIQVLMKGSSEKAQIAPSLYAFLLSKKEDNQEWLNFAMQLYKTNQTIGGELLDFLLINDQPQFILIAHELIDLDTFYWSTYLEAKVNTQVDEALYIRIQTILLQYDNSIERYKKVSSLMTSDQKNTLVDTCYDKNLIVAICEVDHNYEKIMELARKDQYGTDLCIVIKPIINIYPDFCFNRLTLDIEKSLETEGNRESYKRNVLKMKLLSEIHAYEEKAKLFLLGIIKQYYRRTSLKEEMKKAGLI